MASKQKGQVYPQDFQVTLTRIIKLTIGVLCLLLFILVSPYANAISKTQAETFQINTGLNDAWYNPATDGQGFFITVFPDLGKVSLAWFTYDSVRPSNDVDAILGEPGHRWLTAFGDINGDRAEMSIEIASGGLFDTTTSISRRTDGTITLIFNNCNEGTIEYNIPSIGRQGTVPIQRVTTDNVAECEQAVNSAQSSGAAQLLSSSPPKTVKPLADTFRINTSLNDAWYNPVTDGQGFFITVFPGLGKVSLA